jgi:hypothetical protein
MNPTNGRAARTCSRPTRPVKWPRCCWLQGYTNCWELPRMLGKESGMGAKKCSQNYFLSRQMQTFFMWVKVCSYIFCVCFFLICPSFLLSTHKQCICFPKNLAGFEPGSSCSCGGCDVHCATPPELLYNCYLMNGRSKQSPKGLKFAPDLSPTHSQTLQIWPDSI